MLHLAYNIVVYCWLVSVVPVFPHTHIHTHTPLTIGWAIPQKLCVVILQLLLFMGHFTDYDLLKKFTI